MASDALLEREESPPYRKKSVVCSWRAIYYRQVGRGIWHIMETSVIAMCVLEDILRLFRRNPYVRLRRRGRGMWPTLLCKVWLMRAACHLSLPDCSPHAMYTPRAP